MVIWRLSFGTRFGVDQVPVPNLPGDIFKIESEKAMKDTSINNLSHLSNLLIFIIFSLTFSRYEDYIFLNATP